jgi:hypothetical protein
MKNTGRFGFFFDVFWCVSLITITSVMIYIMLIIGTSVILKPKMIDRLNISHDSVKKIERINEALVCPLYSSYMNKKSMED